MSIDRLDLCSLDDVLSYPGMETVPERNLLWLVRLIRGVSMRAQQYTDRLLLLKARTDYFSSDRDRDVISLPGYGSSESVVAEVREASDRDFTASTTVVDAEDYYFDHTTGLIHRDVAWGNGQGTIKVTWTGGLAANTENVPDDLRQAAVLQVVFWWFRQKDLGIASKSFNEGGGVSISAPLNLLPEVEDVFNSYTRPAI